MGGTSSKDMSVDNYKPTIDWIHGDRPWDAKFVAR